MFLPLSDAPNPQRVPWMTYALIAANVAVYALFNLPLGATPVGTGDPRLAEYLRVVREVLPPGVSLQDAVGQVSEYDLFVFEHGFRPTAAQGMDLLTSMFLHGGLMHLVGNMLFLWIYGDNVEYRLGRLGYLAAYLATGVAATLFFTLISPASGVPLVGASGAISGVLGFYFVWFPRNAVRVFVFLFPLVMNVFSIPARVVLGAYLVLDNVLPLLVTFGQSGAGVAHGAHIGGFLAGLAGAWFLDARLASAVPPEYAGAGREAQAGGAEAAIRRGDMETAARTYFAHPSALPADDLLALGEWLATHGHAQGALSVFRRHMREAPAGPGAAEAHLGAGLVELQRGQVASAYQYLRRVEELDPSPAIRARAQAALLAIARQQKYPLRRFAAR